MEIGKRPFVRLGEAKEVLDRLGYSPHGILHRLDLFSDTADKSVNEVFAPGLRLLNDLGDLILHRRLDVFKLLLELANQFP